MLVIFLALLTIALPLFLYGTFYVARQILWGLRSLTWRETAGTILFTKVERYYRGRDLVKEQLLLSYVYTVEGVEHQGSHWSFSSYAWFFGDPKKLELRYPSGQAVVVYYDPLNPENAVLEKGITRADIVLLIVLALMDAGILLIWLPLTPVLILLTVAALVFLILLLRQLRHNALQRQG